VAAIASALGLAIAVAWATPVWSQDEASRPPTTVDVPDSAPPPGPAEVPAADVEERQRTAVLGLLAIVAILLAGLGLITLTIVLGMRTKRLARGPLVTKADLAPPPEPEVPPAPAPAIADEDTPPPDDRAAHGSNGKPRRRS
jgi:hypothetical protein